MNKRDNQDSVAEVAGELSPDNTSYWVLDGIFFFETKEAAETIEQIRNYNDMFDYGFGYDSPMGLAEDIDLVYRTATTDELEQLEIAETNLHDEKETFDHEEEGVFDAEAFIDAYAEKNSIIIKFWFIPGE